MKRTKRRAIIVLGMHRSGTSALAGVLGLLGARLPARQLPANLANPKGFFESDKIVAVHDQILASAGTAWSSWEKIPEGWFSSNPSRVFADELVNAIGEDYGDALLFVVKDPRMCRLMPMWYHVLGRIDTEPCIVIPYRNPVEVAKSLQSRDGLPVAYGCLLWLRHVLEAERQTRGHPRVFTRYHDLLTQPRALIGRIGKDLGVKWPKPVKCSIGEIGDFLDPSLRTQIAEERDIDNMGEISPWLRQAYDCYEALVRSPTDRTARRRLDSLQVSFDAFDATFTPVFKHQAEKHETELAALRAALAARQAEFAALGPVLAERDDRIVALGNTLSQRDTRLAMLDQSLAENKARITKLEQALAEREAKVTKLEQTLAERGVQITALDQLIVARDRELAGLRDALTEQVRTVAALGSTVSALRASTSWRITAPLRWAKNAGQAAL